MISFKAVSPVFTCGWSVYLWLVSICDVSWKLWLQDSKHSRVFSFLQVRNPEARSPCASCQWFIGVQSGYVWGHRHLRIWWLHRPLGTPAALWKTEPNWFPEGLAGLHVLGQASLALQSGSWWVIRNRDRETETRGRWEKGRRARAHLRQNPVQWLRHVSCMPPTQV